VSLTLALLLQSAAPAPAPAPAREAFRTVDAAKAVDTLKATCWAQLRNEEALEAAITMLPIAFQPQPQRGHTRNWRAPEGTISYAAELPAGVPSPQCIVRLSMAGTIDQLAFAARIGAALQLPNGRTRAGVGGSETRWDVAQPDGHVVRLIVTASPAPPPASATNIRFTTLLLPQ